MSATARTMPDNQLPATAAKSGNKPASALSGWIGALGRTATIDAQPGRIFPIVIDELAARHGQAPALIGEQSTVSYVELAAMQNRIARWAIGLGLAPGDTVALVLRNCPEYLAIWLGLSRVGVRVALINTNLRGRGLAHCLTAAAPRLVIAEPCFTAVLNEALRDLTAPAPELWWHGSTDSARALGTALEGMPGDPLADGEAPPVTIDDCALLIYTSGTTGMPKAALVSHRRVMVWTHWFAGLVNPTPDDRMYDCLPLYHSVGGVVAPGSVLVGGGSVVIREKFSASRFWPDVVETGCTLFQYIGELCRYLTLAAPHPLERAHRLRMCTGNGLRPDIWTAFAERFAIPRVLEFYASTEGTVSLYNVEGKVGAIGRIPSFLANRRQALVVRHDVESGLPARGENGLCSVTVPGETGELLGKISAKAQARFEGYSDADATEKKILRNVLELGDAWMRTGDLVRQDAEGFFYFVDRIGDTFRWKGENVATTEVAEALMSCAEVLEASVYGVAVPGAEGKAGMAALTVGPDFDLGKLRGELAALLPAYARPMFLRLCSEIGVTETFKQKKSVLAAEGYDPSQVADPIYVDNGTAYQRLDAAGYAALGASRREVAIG
jgi:fatty-acyl-CoA synthase